MNRWKSSLTCSYCSKILKDPIELPCSHNLCKNHLLEKNIVKENKIKCGECKQDFRIKNNDFKLEFVFQLNLNLKIKDLVFFKPIAKALKDTVKVHNNDNKLLVN